MFLIQYHNNIVKDTIMQQIPNIYWHGYNYGTNSRIETLTMQLVHSLNNQWSHSLINVAVVDEALAIVCRTQQAIGTIILCIDHCTPFFIYSTGDTLCHDFIINPFKQGGIE